MFNHRKKKLKEQEQKKELSVQIPQDLTIPAFYGQNPRDAPKDSEPIPSIMLKVLQKFFHKWTPEA